MNDVLGVSVFKHECQIISQKILELGKKIASILDDERLSKVMLD